MEFSRMKPGTEYLNMVAVEVLEPIGVGTGKISAGEVSHDQAVVVAEQASDRLVDVDPASPSCCIDGRCAKCTMAGEADRPEPRASVAGGALVTAFAGIESTDYFSDAENARSLEDKLEEIDQTLRDGGINPGTHVDTAATAVSFVDPETGAPRTGCGAGDKLPSAVQQPFAYPEVLHAYMPALLGESYNENYVTLVDKDTLAARISDWNPVVGMKKVADKSEGHGVEILQDSHAEKLVVFNFIENKTVDRDALVTETGNQVFVIDMWYIEKIANALAAGRPDAVEMQSKLKHAMVRYQIGVYLELCDGSQRPALLQQKDLELAR